MTMSETAAPAGRQERRKAATRAKIIDAAEELLCANDEATIEQIAQLADVAAATVYTHFSGKQELLHAVVDRALSENERHMLAVYDAASAPFDRLVEAAAAYLRFYRESPQRFRLVALRLGSSAQEPSDSDSMMAKRVDAMTNALADLIAAGIADGSLRPVAQLPAAHFVWGSMNGVIALALRPDQLRLSDAELTDALNTGLRLVFEGLAGEKLRGQQGQLLPSVVTKISSITAPYRS